MALRKMLKLWVALMALIATANAQPAKPGCTLRIATTLASLPTQNGGPDQGTEGLRFMGYTLYDLLIGWDLSHADRAAALVPSIATAWTVDAEDHTRWTITVRDGVHFHDGSLLDLAAVVWNLDKIFNRDAPQYDREQAAQMSWRMPGVHAYRVLDKQHLEITTDGPDSTLPYQLTALFISSPARWKTAGSWAEFGKQPSGTGPWVMQHYAPRESAVLTRNDAYWNPARIPRCDKLVLLPVPDPATRTAALLSGQIDWAEGPAPETVAQLKSAHMQILTGVMPHSWPYTLSRIPGSPLNDIRVRTALNLAVDRQGMVELLNGLALPATGVVEPGDPWYGHPSVTNPLRSGRGEASARRGGLRPGSSAALEVHDLHLRVGADVSVADERVRAAEFRGCRREARVRGAGMAGAAHAARRRRRRGTEQQGHRRA